MISIHELAYALLRHHGIIVRDAMAAVNDLAGMLPLPAPSGGAPIPAHRAILAVDRVRHARDGVAFVVAEAPAQAADAARSIAVDYEPLPACVDAQGPVAPGAAIWSEAPDNVCFDWQTGDAVGAACGIAGARTSPGSRSAIRGSS